MVVALGPGRFYGRNLPRPRFYPDPKLNPTRIDPPESVSAPLLSWANEAHWSMGGLSFRRLRLQGSIEGNISKLRGSVSDKKPRFTKERLDALDESEEEEVGIKEEMVEDEESEGEESVEEVVVVSKKRKRARRLGDEFDQIAERVKGVEKGDKKMNSKENKKGVKKVISKENKKVNKKENSKGNNSEKNKKGNSEENKKWNSEENKKGKVERVRRISPRRKQN